MRRVVEVVTSACYMRHVTRTDPRTWLTGALLALLLAVFGWASPVDAATCGFEPPVAALIEAGHAHAVVDDHSGDPEGSGADHGPVCAHGHCHHGPAAVIPTVLGMIDVAIGDGMPQGGAGSPEPPSSSLSLPDQPPRA